MSGALEQLADLLREDGSVIADHLPEAGEENGAAPLAELVAAGPRAAEAPDEYALLVEAVREGYLLHYGEPRVVRAADEDLRLLAGDYLYALGLERLAGLGDLEAVRELADLISISAQLHAERAGARLTRALAGQRGRRRGRRRARPRAGKGPVALRRRGRRAGPARPGDRDGDRHRARTGRWLASPNQ